MFSFSFQRRWQSTNNSTSPSPTLPVKTYFNAKADKAQILSDNKNKSGIYMFQNLTNGKQYIGSSNNLTKRFYEYFNQNSLLRNKSMAICCALLKHGHSNFAITILEYCSPDKCLIRENIIGIY